MLDQTIWVTGATGFVGGAAVARLQAEGQPVVPVSRRGGEVLGQKACTLSELGSQLSPGSVVLYAAGRAHVKEPASAASREAFWRANCDEPLAAARLAAARGARRFVFVSSVKVNGERTDGTPFSDEDVPQPEDEYGRSKWEGEQVLWRHAYQTGMELVIVRPPLVYGPGVKANFATMMRWLARGVPLPLASVRNRRSLIALDNLVDLLLLCCHHPAAANEVFLASDGEDVSTPELLRMLGKGLGKPAYLLPVPVPMLKLGASLVGREDMLERLCGSLQVNSQKARTRLQWQPPLSLEAGLQAAAQGYLSRR